MTAQEFVWFLHGYLQIENPHKIEPLQTAKIKQYMNSMFSEAPLKQDKENPHDDKKKNLYADFFPGGI